MQYVADCLGQNQKYARDFRVALSTMLLTVKCNGLNYYCDMTSPTANNVFCHKDTILKKKNYDLKDMFMQLFC